MSGKIKFRAPAQALQEWPQLAADDQEIVIKVIAMIAKQRMESALVSVDQ